MHGECTHARLFVLSFIKPKFSTLGAISNELRIALKSLFGLPHKFGLTVALDFLLRAHAGTHATAYTAKAVQFLARA